METTLGSAAFRTQLFNPDDIENVKKVQAGYKVQTLSAFLGQPAPKATPVDFVKPLTVAQQKTSLEFFNVLNNLLQFAPTHPSEVELRARVARIGIGEGKVFDPSKLSPEMKTAFEQGMADAWVDIERHHQEARHGRNHSRRLLRHARISEEQLPVPRDGHLSSPATPSQKRR